MNVFILDCDMSKSATMLDDEHLKAQINEGCQILMANWNHEHFPDAKIGHINHPVTIFYRDDSFTYELFNYLGCLLNEYLIRFKKYHQNHFWWVGFYEDVYRVQTNEEVLKEFKVSKTYVNGIMTDDLEAIRHYIMTKPQQKKPVWTNREKPDWWEV